MKRGNFHGYPTYVVGNEHLTLELLAEAGPRIVRIFRAGDDRNIFAELPQAQLPSPRGPYTLYGGHRLWHAPEVPARTYVADDDGVTVETVADGYRLCRNPDPYSGIGKTIEVALNDHRPSVEVRHNLHNHNSWPVELSAWAITQLAPGGIAVLPQVTTTLDDEGVQPNRRLVLWPYTKWSDPRLRLDDDLLFVEGRRGNEDLFKIGYMNRHGWLGYLWEGLFFIKRHEPEPERPHPDMGCNAEVYTDHRCLELETLTPMTVLAPGEAIQHTEFWELHGAATVRPWPDALREFLNGLSLLSL